jgi:hypothetical protein
LTHSSQRIANASFAKGLSRTVEFGPCETATAGHNQFSAIRTLNISFQEEVMAAAATTLVWWLVVASPQGGMVVMPNSFDSRDACMAAVTEFQKNAGQANWIMQCVPTQDQNFEE